MSFSRPSLESLSHSAQALSLDAQRAGARANITIFYPETETTEEQILVIGTFDTETILEGAVKSVKADITNAREWLEALPQIQTQILKYLEEIPDIVHYLTKDIAIPNVLSEVTGEALVGWISPQGVFLGISEGFVFKGKLYVPEDYLNFDEGVYIIDSLPNSKISWIEISTGEKLVFPLELEKDS